MAIDDETRARIRDALQRSDRVDAGRIDVADDGEEVVLRGAVASPEEATVAVMIAENDAADAVSVRNELRVDEGLREATAQDAGGVAAEDAAAPQRSPEQPAQPADDLTPHAEEALGEGIAWDPPEEPTTAPTQGEERGVLAHDTSVPPSAEEGMVDDPHDVEPSAADMSAAELERTARPQPDHDEDR